jgi:hypothetical protein
LVGGRWNEGRREDEAADNWWMKMECGVSERERERERERAEQQGFLCYAKSGRKPNCRESKIIKREPELGAEAGEDP